MNLKKRLALILMTIMALGASIQSKAQIFQWNEYTVTETITDDCCVLITIDFVLNEPTGLFGDEFDRVLIEQVEGVEFQTVSVEGIGTTGTYTFELCPNEGQLELDFRVRMVDEFDAGQPAFGPLDWALSTLEHTGVGDFSGCCIDCHMQDIGDYLDITVEKNTAHCGPDECYVTGEINLPDTITCFDQYIFYFGDEENEVPQPLVDGQVPELVTGRCIMDGETVMVAVGLKNGDDGEEYCFIDPQFVSCEYTCCDEYPLRVTELNPPLPGYDCCYEYELQDGFASLECASVKLLVQHMYEAIEPTYPGPSDPFTGTICGDYRICEDPTAGICRVSRRFILYDEHGNYLCHKEWNNGELCPPGSSGGEGGIPTGAPVIENGESVLGSDPFGFNIHNIPNPANDFTTIYFTVNEKANVKIELFDINGRSLGIINQSNYEIGEQSFDLITSDYPPGTYLVQFFSSGKIATHMLQIE